MFDEHALLDIVSTIKNINKYYFSETYNSYSLDQESLILGINCSILYTLHSVMFNRSNNFGFNALLFSDDLPITTQNVTIMNYYNFNENSLPNDINSLITETLRWPIEKLSFIFFNMKNLNEINKIISSQPFENLCQHNLSTQDLKVYDYELKNACTFLFLYELLRSVILLDEKLAIGKNSDSSFYSFPFLRRLFQYEISSMYQFFETITTDFETLRKRFYLYYQNCYVYEEVKLHEPLIDFYRVKKFLHDLIVIKHPIMVLLFESIIDVLRNDYYSHTDITYVTSTEQKFLVERAIDGSLYNNKTIFNRFVCLNPKINQFFEQKTNIIFLHLVKETVKTINEQNNDIKRITFEELNKALKEEKNMDITKMNNSLINLINRWIGEYINV